MSYIKQLISIIIILITQTVLVPGFSFISDKT